MGRVKRAQKIASLVTRAWGELKDIMEIFQSLVQRVCQVDVDLPVCSPGRTCGIVLHLGINMRVPNVVWLTLARCMPQAAVPLSLLPGYPVPARRLRGAHGGFSQHLAADL
jgi:hypothetical protein